MLASTHSELRIRIKSTLKWCAGPRLRNVYTQASLRMKQKSLQAPIGNLEWTHFSKLESTTEIYVRQCREWPEEYGCIGLTSFSN